MQKKEQKNDQTLIDEACFKIKQMMFQRVLSPSQKLIYKDLSKMLNISLTPIINALNRLEEQGFLTSSAYRGFCVKPINITETVHLFETRKAIESYIVEKLIPILGPSEIKCLKTLVLSHSKYSPEKYDDKRIILDSEFHLKLALLADNPILENQMRRIFEHILLRFPRESRLPYRIPMANREHKDLMGAIIKKDVKRSVDIIRKHVDAGRDYLVDCLTPRIDESHNLFINRK